MKKIIVFLAIFISSILSAQNLDYAYFELRSDNEDIDNITIRSNNVIFKINSDGSDFTYFILNNNFRNADYNYFQEPVDSSYDYIDPDFYDDTSYRNKNNISYYNDFDEYLNNRLKEVNGIKIKYYDRFDMKKRGKIKSIGNINFDYFDVFSSRENEGKISKIGSNQIKYYDVFDGKDLEYKIKSIGPIKFEYFDAFDRGNKRGQLKRTKGNTKDFLALPKRERAYPY